MSHYVRPDRCDPAPNPTELRLAGEIRTRLEPDIARQLAAVREGATLEGPRKTVSGHAEIPRSVYAGPDGERMVEVVTVHAWRSWFGELLRGGLRPCGWPAVQRTYAAWPAFDASTRGLIEVDAERAEFLIVSVSCEAVPA